jgi:hypothetical protein
MRKIKLNILDVKGDIYANQVKNGDIKYNEKLNNDG